MVCAISPEHSQACAGGIEREEVEKGALGKKKEKRTIPAAEGKKFCLGW